ncbi:glycosyltransferase [Methylobacterium nodulans]|uniref:Glycosyl transferase family 2 n=1 Tax=Methylobacterium nodulans (strain LMG 21967 / CNCM I-2342 / ORS 2060) TaxID=460265 RepID=B8IAC1_METNO|nr:glycosyltransferase [Methylobacterium nodulans]ACL59184.1 glycosyl transferase family 2 [Methylobacterium nodulans ORS 2060]
MTSPGPTPRVSIAMPVRNGGEYFRLALASALAQTYPGIEILVVDDGSADPQEVAGTVAAFGSPKVRLFQQPNGGVASALNTALRHMEGDFFCWLSHDDLYEPHKIEAQLAFHTALARPDAALCSGYSLIGPSGNLIREVELDPAPLRRAPLLALMTGYINGCTVMIPAEVMRACGPFDTRLRYTQDYEMWNRVVRVTDFFLQPERLVRYRIHPGQESHLPAATQESNRLWMDLVDARSAVERTQLFGSTRQFFTAMARHLGHTPYRQAALYAAERAAAAVEDTLVSVVVTGIDSADLESRGIEGLLRQTHRRLDVIIAAEETGSASREFHDFLLDPRVRCIAGGRNRVLDAAKGEYIVFADARQVWASDRITQQVDAMQEAGVVASHASPVADPSRPRLYPAILDRPLVTTTGAMIHRSLVAAGHRFPPGPASDWLFWIGIAASCDILAVDLPPAAPAGPPSEEEAAQVAAFVVADPLHSRRAGSTAARPELNEATRIGEPAREPLQHCNSRTIMLEQPDLEGRRFAAPDGSGIWLVLLSERRHIVDQDVYDGLFADTNGIAVDEAAMNLPVGPPLGPGTGLIRADGDHAIYLLAVDPGGMAIRHWFTSEEAFRRLKFDWRKVYGVADDVVAQIERGAPLT